MKFYFISAATTTASDEAIVFSSLSRLSETIIDSSSAAISDQSSYDEQDQIRQRRNIDTRVSRCQRQQRQCKLDNPFPSRLAGCNSQLRGCIERAFRA